MPNRLLRPWTGSDKIDKISPHAERFFVRLIMTVDDFGRYYANARLLNSALFPLKEDIRDSDISRWINECETAGLIAVYEVNSKSYLEILDFNQRLRQKNERFPPKKHDSQMTVRCQSDDRTNRREVEEKGREDAREQTANQFQKPNIPTKMQVWEYFSKQGATKEMAKSFYEKHEGVGWYMNGSPIVKWAALASRFITNWKDKEGSESSAPPLKTA